MSTAKYTGTISVSEVATGFPNCQKVIEFRCVIFFAVQISFGDCFFSAPNNRESGAVMNDDGEARKKMLSMNGRIDFRRYTAGDCNGKHLFADPYRLEHEGLKVTKVEGVVVVLASIVFVTVASMFQCFNVYFGIPSSIYKTNPPLHNPHDEILRVPFNKGFASSGVLLLLLLTLLKLFSYCCCRSSSNSCFHCSGCCFFLFILFILLLFLYVFLLYLLIVPFLATCTLCSNRIFGFSSHWIFFCSFKHCCTGSFRSCFSLSFPNQLLVLNIQWQLSAFLIGQQFKGSHLQVWRHFREWSRLDWTTMFSILWTCCWEKSGDNPHLTK